MRNIISRWFMFGLLVGWALTHATVFAQPSGGGKTPDKAADKPAIEKLRASLDKNITLDYTGGSLVDVLNHFRDKTGIAINVDQMAMMQMGVFDGGFNPGGPAQQVQIKATNEKASTVLRRLLNGNQLAYVIFEDAVLITTEESALMRQMRQRVSVDLDDVPFSKAVRSLAKNHGINLVIDPKIARQADTAVSLQLENTGIETAVRLLAELANLKAVRMGNVLFVTTEEKADKIRKEEPNQFDNPLNPNLPMFRGGIGIGGLGGIMPMPARAVPPVALPPNAGGIAPPPGILPPDAPPPLRAIPDPAVPKNVPNVPPPPPPHVRPAVNPSDVVPPPLNVPIGPQPPPPSVRPGVNPPDVVPPPLPAIPR